MQMHFVLSISPQQSTAIEVIKKKKGVALVLSKVIKWQKPLGYAPPHLEGETPAVSPFCFSPW